MARRAVAALLALTAVAATGCRTDAVRLGFDAEPGTSYTYRYEIDARVTRQVEGEEPRTTTLHMTFESEQTVVSQTPDGTLMEVTLTAPQAAPRRAQVLLDRAGSLRAIEEIDGLPAAEAGLPSAASLLAATSTELPKRALRLGDTWDVALGTLSGEGRLDHLAVLDGERAAVVEATLVEVLTDTVESGGSQVVLDGDLETDASTAYDLTDGSVRRSRTRSAGTVSVLVSPPVDVLAPAVEAVIVYALEVRAVRID